MLKDRILNKEKGLVLYALTPPKADFKEEKLLEISARWQDRINDINADGLVLYEVQDESERNESERTFEFSSTLTPNAYYNRYLGVKTPGIFYRVVGAYSEDSLERALSTQASDINVFVGKTSHSQNVKITLKQAYEIAKRHENLCLGGICIPERHAKKGNEPEMMKEKIAQGVKFFVSQAIFDKDKAISFLDACAKARIDVPIFLTFSTAGNEKTLEFIKWLGVSVPKEVQDRLESSEDYLQSSCKIIKEIYAQLKDFGDKNGLNLSVNIESVMAKRAEILASLELTKELKRG
ncbi:MAG: methylenetetrahydrofolate reductase [Campylobacter sp.]|nr:methylenetetrahydrofolate reductase [Campylobacter sp.]